MNFTLECSIHFKNEAGNTVEVKSLEGSKGYLIEVITTNTTGLVSKEFSEYASSPVPKEKIYEAILLEVSSLLKQQYKINESSIPLVFPEISFEEFSPTSIPLTRAEPNEYEDMAMNDANVAQAVMIGEPVRLFIAAGRKHFVSMKDKHGQLIAIPVNLLSTMAEWFVVDGVSEIVLDGYLTHDGNLTLTDILYDKGSLTELLTLTRLRLLSKLSLAKGSVTVAEFGTGKQEVEKLRQACSDTGLSLVFSMNTNISQETKRWIMEFKEETKLTVMGIDHSHNQVKLCANISNIPIELGRAPIPKGMELKPLDGVAIKYGKVAAGELVHVEITSKLDTTELIPLDPVLAKRLGFSVRPVEVNSPGNQPSLTAGILSALDAASE
ncbi:TPA: hypothetical protein ACGSTL_001367 [Vibrio parahaemolyticus]